MYSPQYPYTSRHSSDRLSNSIKREELGFTKGGDKSKLPTDVEPTIKKEQPEMKSIGGFANTLASFVRFKPETTKNKEAEREHDSVSKMEYQRSVGANTQKQHQNQKQHGAAGVQWRDQEHAQSSADTAGRYHLRPPEERRPPRNYWENNSSNQSQVPWQNKSQMQKTSDGNRHQTTDQNFQVVIDSDHSNPSRFGLNHETRQKRLQPDLSQNRTTCARANKESWKNVGDLEIEIEAAQSEIRQVTSKYQRLMNDHYTLSKERDDLRISLNQSEKKAAKISEMLRISNSEGEIQRAELEKELGSLKTREAHLASTIEKFHRAIAFTHSRNEFHEEKDDAYFQAGFADLDSSIQNWVFANFRGAKELLPIVVGYCVDNFASLSPDQHCEPKEVALRLRLFVISVIIEGFFETHHCGMDKQLSGALDLVLRYFPESGEKKRWKARTVYQFLQDPEYQKNITHRVDQAANYIENHLSSIACSTSKPESRMKKLKKILKSVVELSNESQLLSTSVLELRWPDSSDFDSKSMDCPDFTANEGDRPRRLRGFIFPAVYRTTLGDEGTPIASIIRKATVHIPPSQTDVIGTQASAFSIASQLQTALQTQENPQQRNSSLVANTHNEKPSSMLTHDRTHVAGGGRNVHVLETETETLEQMCKLNCRQNVDETLCKEEATHEDSEYDTCDMPDSQPDEASNQGIIQIKMEVEDVQYVSKSEHDLTGPSGQFSNRSDSYTQALNNINETKGDFHQY